MANTIIKYNNTQIAEVAPGESTTLDTKGKWLNSRIEIAGGDGDTTVKYNDVAIAEIGSGETTTLDTKDKWIEGRIDVETIVSTLYVGGRIFYDDGDNGATYTFYDASGNVITDISISGLANAVTYEISGTPTKDRWYVYDNTTHTTGGKTATNGVVDEIYWGYYDIETGARWSLLGGGKLNTDEVLAITDTSSYQDGIFKYIKTCRDENLNGCNDWYIGNPQEIEYLCSAVTTINKNGMWSSVELYPTLASCYLVKFGGWLEGGKSDTILSSRPSATGHCIALRSF